MTFYRRNLPHWQPGGAEYFITFRLANSLPKKVITALIQRRKELLDLFKKEYTSSELSERQLQINQNIFKKYETQLDKGETGPTWLSNESVANIVKEALHYRDQDQYDLYAYCLMSNHVHLVFKPLTPDKLQSDDSPLSDYPVTDLLKKLKSYTAVNANRVLERTGQFWHRESYDRVIRNSDELERTIAYTLNNPVKAGLVSQWEEWPHSYCKTEFLDTFSTKK